MMALTVSAFPEEAGNELAPAAAHEALLQFLYMAPIGVIQFGVDGAVELMNPASVSLLKSLSPASELDNIFDILEPFAPRLRALTEQFAASSGSVCGAVRIRFGSDHGGAVGPRTLSIELFKLDAIRRMAVLRDASGEVDEEQRVLRAASHIDALTKMPNRAAVREHIQQGLRSDDGALTRPCAVLFVNVDRFRQINDSLGYAAGDRILSLIAGRMRATLRHGSRTTGKTARQPVAARLGGDEFAVVLNDIADAGKVSAVAHRLAAVLEQPLSLGAHELRCSVSIGIVLQADLCGDADGVLRDAGIAAKEAKRRGGGRCVVFEPWMRESAERRQDIEEQLRTAIARRELFVMYQPVISFASMRADGRSMGSLAGVEALVRWRHPVRGVVSPLEFIGIAEECGLIGALGHFVLDEACHRFMAWRRELGSAAPRTLAVNLSRGQLESSDVVASVAEVLRQSGMDARDLQLELTESLAAQDENIQSRLHELKALGLTLALDDFGTGFSSLSSLHLLPVDTVKVDRSFVSEAVTSAHHRALIEATVKVAASLCMNTVAEGIETQPQALLLSELGCDKGQGYFFSRPLEHDSLVEWVRSPKFD